MQPEQTMEQLLSSHQDPSGQKKMRLDSVGPASWRAGQGFKACVLARTMLYRLFTNDQLVFRGANLVTVARGQAEKGYGAAMYVGSYFVLPRALAHSLCPSRLS